MNHPDNISKGWRPGSVILEDMMLGELMPLLRHKDNVVKFKRPTTNPCYPVRFMTPSGLIEHQFQCHQNNNGENMSEENTEKQTDALDHTHAQLLAFVDKLRQDLQQHEEDNHHTRIKHERIILDMAEYYQKKEAILEQLHNAEWGALNYRVEFERKQKQSQSQPCT